MNKLAWSALRQNFLRQLDELQQLPERYQDAAERRLLIKKLEELDRLLIQGPDIEQPRLEATGDPLV